MKLALLMVFLPYVSTRIVRTTLGQVRGVESEVLGREMNTYYGVPFAKPPTGDLRFKHPVPAEPWADEVKDATSPAPMCVQNPSDTPGQPLRIESSIMSEDCLYLNVWVPGRENRNLATIVWIYGGAYTAGSINRPLYDGRYLASYGDVIVISINYRVGALGFLYLGTEDMPGNQGMMDQVLALKWIKENIEHFGGNKMNITLFGESAGASSVAHHLLSPLSDDLFTTAILASASATSAFASKPKELSKQITQGFGTAAGCTPESISDCIRDIPYPGILHIQGAIDNGFVFGPVVDGYFLPDNPSTLLANGSLKKVNTLVGVQKNEGSLFLIPLFPTIFPLDDSINVTRVQFLQTVDTFSALLGVPSKAILDKYDTAKPYEEIADSILGDSLFKCPIVTLANSASQKRKQKKIPKNKVYMYSFEHLIESTPLPNWMGVPHSYGLDFMFGHPFGNVVNATEAEKELSGAVMTYLSNFANYGDPNGSRSRKNKGEKKKTSKWPRYRQRSKKYLILDVGPKLKTRKRLRESECQFWNQDFNAA